MVGFLVLENQGYSSNEFIPIPPWTECNFISDKIVNTCWNNPILITLYQKKHVDYIIIF